MRICGYADVQVKEWMTSKEKFASKNADRMDRNADENCGSNWLKLLNKMRTLPIRRLHMCGWCNMHTCFMAQHISTPFICLLAMRYATLATGTLAHQIQNRVDDCMCMASVCSAYFHNVCISVVNIIAQARLCFAGHQDMIVHRTRTARFGPRNHLTTVIMN